MGTFADDIEAQLASSRGEFSKGEIRAALKSLRRAGVEITGAYTVIVALNAAEAVVAAYVPAARGFAATTVRQLTLSYTQLDTEQRAAAVKVAAWARSFLPVP